MKSSLPLGYVQGSFVHIPEYSARMCVFLGLMFSCDVVGRFPYPFLGVFTYTTPPPSPHSSNPQKQTTEITVTRTAAAALPNIVCRRKFSWVSLSLAIMWWLWFEDDVGYCKASVIYRKMVVEQ